MDRQRQQPHAATESSGSTVNVGSTQSSDASVPSPDSMEITPVEGTNLSSEIPAKKPSGTKRKQLEAWEHFSREIINGETKAICNHCKKNFVGRPSDGTTDLLKHKDNFMARRRVDIRQYAIGNSRNKNDGKVEFSKYVFDQVKARQELARMIIMHEYALNMVSHIGFQEFCHSLQPSFVVVSRNTIRNDIIKIYEAEKEKTMKLLEKNMGRIAITTDMWTASNQNKGYMVITAHFVDDSWVLQSRIIRFIYVPWPHISEVISDYLMETFLDWNIDRKISMLTLDNCSTNDAVIYNLMGRLKKSSLILNGRLIHMRCCAHILNIIVQYGLSVIGQAIGKIRNSVAFWTATPKRQERFETVAKQLDLSCSKRLILDCKTRWNSTYLMLVSAISYKDVFPRLEQREPLYKGAPTNGDWEMAGQISEKLQIFYEVTQLFSGNKYPTANIYFPQVCEIRLALSNWLMSDVVAVQDMASSMLLKYDKYWDMIHGIMGVAAILDPRYKCALLEFYFADIYGEEADGEIKRICRLCEDLVAEYIFKGDQRPSSEVQSQLLSQNSSSMIQSGSRQDRLARFDQFLNNKTSSSTTRSELKQYLDEPVLPRSNDFDILAWWRISGIRYLVLQRIARDIYAIPISTVASESSFSTGGRLVSPYRNRLNPDTLEALMCAQNWIGATMSLTTEEDSDEVELVWRKVMTIDGHRIHHSEDIINLSLGLHSVSRRVATSGEDDEEDDVGLDLLCWSCREHVTFWQTVMR